MNPVVVALALAISAVVIATRFMHRHRVRMRPAVRAHLPHATSHPHASSWAELLDTIAHHVRTGHSVQAAYELAVLHHHVHGQVVRTDVPFASALVGTTPDADEAVVLQSLVVAHRFGGPVAAALQAGVSVLRERAVVRADLQVHSAQARLSARVLTGVPIVFCGWGLAGSRSVRAAVATPLGIAAALGGAALNLAGWASMRRIIQQAAP
ncbi:MAG: hypothetical protein WCI22_18535 [Actinomycetota bacterium]